MWKWICVFQRGTMNILRSGIPVNYVNKSVHVINSERVCFQTARSRQEAALQFYVVLCLQRFPRRQIWNKTAVILPACTNFDFGSGRLLGCMEKNLESKTIKKTNNFYLIKSSSLQIADSTLTLKVSSTDFEHFLHVAFSEFLSFQNDCGNIDSDTKIRILFLVFVT